MTRILGSGVDPISLREIHPKVHLESVEMMFRCFRMDLVEDLRNIPMQTREQNEYHERKQVNSFAFLGVRFPLYNTCSFVCLLEGSDHVRGRCYCE